MTSVRRKTAAVLAGCALAVPAVAVSAPGSVFAGHSGWFWANPLPQGNTLRAVDFSGIRGYAVGDFGTVMRSDDSGATWSGLTTGTTVSFRAVRVIAPDVFVVAGKCLVERSDDGGKSFVALPWTPAGSACRSQVRSLAFPTSEVGYLVLSNGSVLRTADGGRSWAARTAVPGTSAITPASTMHPTDIFFTSTATGFVTSEGGALYRTTDGGTSWTPVAAAPQHLDSLTFVDGRTGFAVGGASVLETTNGGDTWTQQGIVQPPESLDWIRCGDALKCIVATTQGDELLRTDDGGNTWTPITPASRQLFAAAYAVSGSVVAVGAGGTMVASPDGGHNFTTISGGLDATFTLVRATSADVAYAAGQAGAIARTTDGGKDWALLTPPTSNDIIDVSFPTEQTGFALAPQNVLMRTDDSGGSWRLLDTGTFVAARAVVAVDADNIVLVMQRGVRRSSDGGLNFARSRQKAVATASFVNGGRAGDNVFAFGRHALAVSDDDGVTWRAAKLPGARESLSKVDFVNGAVAYALTMDGRAWKTVNGGQSWQELVALGSEIGTDIAFSDASDGYVAMPEFGGASGGYVMRTTDGGASWRPQLVDSTHIRPGALAASGPDNAFVVAGANHLLFTDRGGDVGARSSLGMSIARKRPGRPGVIAITGTLKPARGGETVVVSKRQGRSSRWLFRDVTVSASGRFSVFTNVTRTTSFVAQWSGDDERIGAGTARVMVGIGRRYTKP